MLGHTIPWLLTLRESHVTVGNVRRTGKWQLHTGRSSQWTCVEITNGAHKGTNPFIFTFWGYSQPVQIKKGKRARRGAHKYLYTYVNLFSNSGVLANGNVIWLENRRFLLRSMRSFGVKGDELGYLWSPTKCCRSLTRISWTSEKRCDGDWPVSWRCCDERCLED